MQFQSQKTCDQSKQSSAQGVDELKKKISFTNTQLHEIISNPQNFSQRIKELNRKACKQNNNQFYQQAIVYLSEAQKNLQYAANCGLAIDRSLITTTLKNEACVYQRLWELSTCYDYMQALIFNMSIYNEDSKDLFSSTAIKDSDSHQYKVAVKIINQKLNLALCHLQFSALSSQLGKHQQAHKAVQKSLQQFKVLCMYCQSYQKVLKNKTSIVLDQIRFFVEQKNLKMKVQNEIKLVKKSIQKIKNHTHFFTFDQKIIERLSMGDIMQIQFVTIQEANKFHDLDWFISQLGLTYITIYVACCFFALATQIRLSAQQSKFLQQQTKSQMNLAKIYHLHSIKMASEFVLIQSNFLNHILKSFKNNFNIDILNYNCSEIQNFGQISQIQISQQKKVKLDIKLDEQKRIQITNNTKVLQPDLNQYVDNVVKRHTQIKLKKEVSNRKLSNAVSPKLVKKISTGISSKQKAIKQKNRSTQNKKLQNKSSKKLANIGPDEQKSKNEVNDYFSKIGSTHQNQKLNKLNGQKLPKTKLSRQSKSRSKPKLKFKSIKSPLKQ